MVTQCTEPNVLLFFTKLSPTPICASGPEIANTTRIRPIPAQLLPIVAYLLGSYDNLLPRNVQKE